MPIINPIISLEASTFRALPVSIIPQNYVCRFLTPSRHYKGTIPPADVYEGSRTADKIFRSDKILCLASCYFIVGAGRGESPPCLHWYSCEIGSAPSYWIQLEFIPTNRPSRYLPLSASENKFIAETALLCVLRRVKLGARVLYEKIGGRLGLYPEMTTSDLLSVKLGQHTNGFSTLWANAV